MRTIVLLLASTAIIAGCSGARQSASTSTTTTSQRTAAAMQPTAETQDAQQRLRNLGIYNGPIDGVWGLETQAAVEQYQRQRGLSATGRIDEPTRLSLGEIAPATPGTAPSMGSATSPQVALSNPTDVRTVQNRLRQINYYQGEATGMWTPDTQVAVENFQRARGLPVGRIDQATLGAMGLDSTAMADGRIGNVAAAPGTATQGATGQGATAQSPQSMAGISPAAGPGAGSRIVMGSQLDRASARNVQQRLAQEGYYKMKVDGVWGRGSQSALLQFQRARNIDADGRLTPATVTALGLDPNTLGARSTGSTRRQ